MKDPTLIGKDDEFGQSKYLLNIDEEALDKFYERLNHNSIHESHMDNRDPSEALSVEILYQAAYTFKEMIDAVQGDTAEPYMYAEIVFPFVIRGLVILLLNPSLMDNDDQEIMITLMNAFENLIATNNQTELFLERYLT